ncbi:DUF6447 family protein [Halomonas sp. PBN3]|uniref:DUF6447 family protein n=1 Tax=Halomonas sp. PBN3 TaxID=1397528 RepID=UPI0003B87134|nr:DUF6447 family protein [Halomonas sp. PBN3]ERS84116.1 hypothetical protein Q671_10620 [Halomonas sp. PBN3]
MSKRRGRQQDSKNIETQGETEAVNMNAQERGDKPSVTIDGATYTLESLGEQGREQLQNLRVTDQEMRRLQDQLAIMQTARNTYARILGDVVKNVAPQA